jgi:hypothetical protein
MAMRSAIGFQESLFTIMVAAQSVCVAMYEDRAREEVIGELSPGVLKIAEDAAEFLTTLIEAYEPDEPDSPLDASASRSFLHLVDDLMASEAVRGRVADLAFLGRLELRRKTESLRSLMLGEGDSWPVIAAAGSVLRSLRKAVTAVEASLCECEGLTPRLGFTDEVEASLAARCAYAKFRFEIRCYSPRPDIAERLLGAATSLAKLVGGDVYESLRIEDRIHLRELQERVLAWSRGPRDADAGNRLWGDVAGFSELMAGIRNRQELVRHDRELVGDLVVRLRRGEDFEVHRPRVRSLLGRDDDLDEVLLSSRKLGAGVVQDLLERIASEARIA